MTKKFYVRVVEKLKKKGVGVAYKSIEDKKNYNREWYQKNKEWKNEYCKYYRGTKKGRAEILFQSSKKRAKKTGVKFNLSKSWLLDKLEGRCEITGTSFSFEPPREGYKCDPFAPSLERIIPKGNYTKDNVKVVIWAVNVCKWEWTVKDFKKIIKAIYKGLKNYE